MFVCRPLMPIETHLALFSSQHFADGLPDALASSPVTQYQASPSACPAVSGCLQGWSAAGSRQAGGGSELPPPRGGMLDGAVAKERLKFLYAAVAVGAGEV